jgi:hypothetical protein
MNYLETRKRCAERPATDGFAAAVTTELMWKGGDARMRRRAVPIRNRLLRTARCCASGAFRESPARHRTVVRYRCPEFGPIIRPARCPDRHPGPAAPPLRLLPRPPNHPTRHPGSTHLLGAEDLADLAGLPVRVVVEQRAEVVYVGLAGIGGEFGRQLAAAPAVRPAHQKLRPEYQELSTQIHHRPRPAPSIDDQPAGLNNTPGGRRHIRSLSRVPD